MVCTSLLRHNKYYCSGWGGICCFSLTVFASNIVCISTSSEAERQWHVLHTSCGPFLLVTQYRPPHYGEISSIDSLEDELNIFSLDVFGTIMIGDFNVHNKQWLKFSCHDSPEGYALQQLCQRQGFL